MFTGASLGTYTVLYPYITKLVFDSTSVKWHLGALFLINNAKRFSGASSDYVEIELKKEVQVAKAGWGSKLTCHKCGVKYYDMKKKNVRCPKCDAEYKAVKIKPRRGMRTDNPKSTPKKTIKSDPEGEVIDVDLDDEDLDAGNDGNQDNTIMEDTSDISGDDEDIEEVVGVVDNSTTKE